MRGPTRKFEIEALEARVLLSGDGLLALETLPQSDDPSAAATSIVESNFDLTSAPSTEITYDPASMVEDIFGGERGEERGENGRNEEVGKGT